MIQKKQQGKRLRLPLCHYCETKLIRLVIRAYGKPSYIVTNYVYCVKCEKIFKIFLEEVTTEELKIIREKDEEE